MERKREVESADKLDLGQIIHREGDNYIIRWKSGLLNGVEQVFTRNKLPDNVTAMQVGQEFMAQTTVEETTTFQRGKRPRITGKVLTIHAADPYDHPTPSERRQWWTSLDKPPKSRGPATGL